jgi:hypothetical protein
MKLNEYYDGISLEGYSPLSQAECEARIAAAAKSQFNPFAFGTIGWARRGKIYLRRRSWFEYNAKPVLTGRLEPDGSGCRASLRFRGPLWARIFHVFWYVFLSLIFIGVLAHPADKNSVKVAGLMIAFLGAAPLVIHYLGTLGAMRELDELLRFLRATAQFSPAGEQSRT